LSAHLGKVQERRAGTLEVRGRHPRGVEFERHGGMCRANVDRPAGVLPDRVGVRTVAIYVGAGEPHLKFREGAAMEGAQDQLACWQGSHTSRVTSALFGIGSV
jgi:hypothetical protein